MPRKRSKPDEPLFPVFMPALVALLLNRERSKGSPLTEEEVLAIRDAGVCVMMPLAAATAVAEERGYDDIDPENAWEQWQEIRESLHQEG